jgi:hypothetical protein
MADCQLDVDGKEVPATTVGLPHPPPAPAPKPVKVPAPLPELDGQLGFPLIPDLIHDPSITLF